MIGAIAKGTIENIFVDITDVDSTVTTLVGTGPTFDVIDPGDVFKVTAGSGVTANGMRLTVPLDTTVGGVWAEGEYRLFVKFTVGAQTIRKGPFYFQIVE